MLKYIPNVLTLFRLILIIPFLNFLFRDEFALAFYTFFLAGVTDALDGWLARYFSWQSYLGSFIDPMADKSLITASFISLALLGTLPWWLVLLVFLRDATISIGFFAWVLIMKEKPLIKPSLLSKWNTAFQLLLVTLCLFDLAFGHISAYLIEALIYITATTTFITYVDYLWTWGHKAWFKQR